MTAEAQAVVAHLQHLVGELRGLLVQHEADVQRAALALHTVKLAAIDVEQAQQVIENMVGSAGLEPAASSL